MCTIMHVKLNREVRMYVCVVDLAYIVARAIHIEP